jgi:hypothetical protein
MHVRRHVPRKRIACKPQDHERRRKLAYAIQNNGISVKEDSQGLLEKTPVQTDIKVVDGIVGEVEKLELSSTSEPQ